jgi:hypothetical protein
MVRLTLPLESQGNDFFFKVRSLTLKDLRETLPQHVSRVKIAGYQPIEFGSYPHEKQDRSSKLFGLILACVICALVFIGIELANALFGWEDELGFHFGAP